MKLKESAIGDFILENCKEGVLIFDLDFRYTLFNPAMEELTGFRKEECLGKKVTEIFPFLTQNELAEISCKIQKGKSFSVENQVLYLPIKGRVGYYSAQYTPVYNNQDHVCGILAIVQEKTSQHTLTKALEDAEERYINLVKYAPLSIVVFSEEEILYVNPRTLDLLKAKEKGQLVGRSPLHFVPPAEKSVIEKDIIDILANVKTEPLEQTLICFDGAYIDVQITYHPFTYFGKKAIQAIIRDISKEKKNFAELMAHQEQLSEAQSMALLGSYSLYPEDNTTVWTDGLLQILQIPCGQNQQSLDAYLSLMYEEEEKRQLLLLFQKLKDGLLSEASMSHGVLLGEGKRKYLKINGRAKRDEEGKLLCVVGTIQDVTAQRAIEEQLYRANQILNLHFENSPLAIVQLNSKLEVSHWSKRAEEIFGWEGPEVVGKKILSLPLFLEGGEEGFQRLDQKIKKESFSYKNNNVKLLTRNKTIVHCEAFMSGISGEDNQLNSILILLNDVTTRQLAEEARLEGQQEERKRVARDIHDGIGQMLIAIKYKIASLEPLIEEENHFKLQHLEGMLEQALEEARSISKNLAPRSVATMGLESSLRQMCEQVKRLTAIDLKFRYIGGEQEVNHKVVNALYRVAQEATQNIIKHAQASEAHLQIFQGRNFIELKVEDNGRGILEEGTGGNGLKNMEERVKLLGGRFQIYSEEGRGTSLIVNIPIGATSLN